MSKISRRTVLRASLGLAAAGTIARPFVANAAAKTATVWWVQGFVKEEDASFHRMVAEKSEALKERAGCGRVHFSVAVEDGRVSFKAKADK